MPSSSRASIPAVTPDPTTISDTMSSSATRAPRPTRCICAMSGLQRLRPPDQDQQRRDHDEEYPMPQRQPGESAPHVGAARLGPDHRGAAPLQQRPAPGSPEQRPALVEVREAQHAVDRRDDQEHRRVAPGRRDQRHIERDPREPERVADHQDVPAPRPHRRRGAPHHHAPGGDEAREGHPAGAEQDAPPLDQRRVAEIREAASGDEPAELVTLRPLAPRGHSTAGYNESTPEAPCRERLSSPGSRSNTCRSSTATATSTPRWSPTSPTPSSA